MCDCRPKAHNEPVTTSKARIKSPKQAPFRVINGGAEEIYDYLLKNLFSFFSYQGKSSTASRSLGLSLGWIHLGRLGSGNLLDVKQAFGFSVYF